MASVPFCCLLWLILNCCHISSHLEVNGIYSNSFDQVPPLPPPMFAQVCPWQNKVSGNKFVSTPKFKAEIHATPMFILRHCKPKSFWSILLLLSGDVKINPGPVTFPCGNCGRAVASNHRGICCDTCNKWFHIRCANITPQEYSALCHSIEDWYCENCISDNDRRQRQLSIRRKRYHEQTDEEWEYQLEARRQRYSEQTDEERQQQLAARRQQYQEGTGSQISSHDDYLHNGGWKLQSLHEQSWANECMKAFHRKQNQWQHRKCIICSEQWPVRSYLNLHPYICIRCHRDKNRPKTFSSDNNMDPGSLPPCLEHLTQVEEMLIARACPIMTVYHKHGGQRGYSGHVLNLPQNTQQFLNQLPAKVNTLPILVVR